ncbi:MAG: hypothetical protein N3B13_06110 [Deltaproteobacteria bacterium]|nr:hypothetical protein [Deltaproteobacteria bacterium]
MRFLLCLSSLVLSLLLFIGATCSPVSPPAFTPSRTLTSKSEKDISVNMFGGLTSQVFDLGGYGGGFEAEYRLREDTDVVFGVAGAKGEDDLQNNHSVFEVGTGVVKYVYQINDTSYLLAFEPRIDFAYITNGSVSFIPNLTIHSSYKYKFFEPKLTVRAGSSLLLLRGDNVNIDKDIIESEVYKKDFLKDIVYVGADTSLLLHAGKIYAGPGLGVMHTISLRNCDNCSDLWFYYLLNAGFRF